MNQLVSRSIIVNDCRLCPFPSTACTSCGPIKSTHSRFHGSASVTFNRIFHTFVCVTLAIWKVSHKWTYLRMSSRMVPHEKFRRIVNFVLSTFGWQRLIWYHSMSGLINVRATQILLFLSCVILCRCNCCT